jgi:hypothetical protein
MDILTLLVIFFFLATVIKIATDNAAAVMKVFKPFKGIQKYKLVIALVLTTVGVFGLNKGILEALNVPLEVSRSWFHYFDLVATTLFLTAGSQVIHKLNDAWKEYNNSKEGE